MQITFLVKLNDYWIQNINVLRKEFPDHSFITYEDVQNPEEYIDSSDGIVVARAKQFNIDNADKLKILFVPWTGVDFMPWQIVKSRKIIVANTHGNSFSVAERALSLCLALLGRVVEFHNDLKEGVWHGFTRGSIKDDFWISLYGRKCTILGLGSIGLKLSKLLKSFNCHVTGYKKNINIDKPGSVDHITDNLQEAVSSGEIIFVFLPLTNETKGIINNGLLSLMKGKYLNKFLQRGINR